MVQYEIGQFDIPNRHLAVIKEESEGDEWTDIGKAKITHSIFGKARVRVIRKKDKTRRACLMAVMASVALAGSIWLVWNAAQNARLLQNETVMPPVSIKPPEPALVEDGNLASGMEGMPYQPLDLKVSERIGEQPEARPVLPENNLRTEMSARSKPKSASKTQASASVNTALPASGTVAGKPALPAASGGPLIEKGVTIDPAADIEQLTEPAAP